MNRPPLRLREISLFFFPLLLNVQLMSLSHTIINATLARYTDYITALAGMSVAMVVHLFIASPSYQNHTVTITMVRGRQSLRGVLIFVALVAVYVSIMLALIAYTRLGDLLLINLLGVPPAIAQAARAALQLLALLPIFTGLRGFFQGLVIQARRTSLISLATGIRVAALLGYLALGQRWFAGAQLGAFALVSCVVTETLLMAYFAWRVHLPLTVNPQGEKTSREVLRYAFPLAYSSCLQQTIPLLINSILGRLPDAPMALAAFGVIRGFLFLLAGPMRNLQQAYLSLVKTTADNHQLQRFAAMVALGLGLLVALVAGPAAQLILGQALGVKPGLLNYLRLPLAACALFPLLYAVTNLLRGWFAGADKTDLLGYSTLFKCSFLLLIWWPILRFQPPVSGITIGISLLLAAEAIEAVYLSVQRQRQVDLKPLPPLE
ncbi:MATE family efflux transporter [Geopsychrobacter electrodiphilus]|uniref:MATE family efflux transporter n=1 Tax=Geopsychrobacter electrodiphilus TaxID=225196 RepID=UPI000380FB60|nr:MATE family efflux transporter [Geopsychrobacter electrodiphilus]